MRAAVAALLLAGGLAVPDADPGQPATEPPAAGSQQIVVDGAGAGRTFAGVGAISGGGGTSRLLVDYPEPQRSQILDYLFTPGVGASLQILKVEIGADTNSSNGAEPGHMRTPAEVDCDRGYEWWLMEQARRRNPQMRFYGLEWGAPGWFAGGFWSDDNIRYLMRWLGCARRHGLRIDYLGGWNEKEWDAAWYVKLKAALVGNGFGHVQVVAADNAGWKIATELRNDPAFNAAVDVVGIHYPCSVLRCSRSQDAIDLGKPLFASESGWNNYLTGAVRLAAEMNHEYVDSGITAFINWPAAYAWYPTVQMQGSGLLKANEPWSGHYQLGPTLWTVAQTAQFTRPGWRYLDAASGYLDGGGTYVTLRSPGPRPQYTTVFETTAATAPQSVRLTGGSGRPLHRWSTTLASTDPADWFTRGADVPPGHAVTLEPGTVTTLTTLPRGRARLPEAPVSHPMPLPYRENFDSYRPSATPRLFADMEGAFEVGRCRCLQQVVTTPPIKWSRVASPLTLVGDNRWTDYTVSGQLNNVGPARVNVWQGYYLRLADTGSWSLEVLAPDKTTRTLASGTRSAAAGDAWHRLSLGFAAATITASIDGAVVARVTDQTYANGQAGLALDTYTTTRFDDLAVTP
jgi:glycosyl hydrolase family 59/glycosyl hydrolase family 59 (putative galactocerebrosidase)